MDNDKLMIIKNEMGKAVWDIEKKYDLQNWGISIKWEVAEIEKVGPNDGQR